MDRFAKYFVVYIGTSYKPLHAALTWHDLYTVFYTSHDYHAGLTAGMIYPRGTTRYPCEMYQQIDLHITLAKKKETCTWHME